MKLVCCAEGCDRVVVEGRPIDFGLALTFCKEHAVSYLTNVVVEAAKVDVHPILTREDA
jgi:hypothetical protein